MRGLWALGQRAAALEQYQACRRLLATELRLESSPELTATRRAAMGTPLPPSRRSRYAADLDAARQALSDERFAAAWAERAA
jgi:hypothetical protein